MLHPHLPDEALRQHDMTLAPLFAQRALTDPVPRLALADDGVDPDAAYQLVHEELELDGNPLLNLASFVTTWMEPQAHLLFTETLPKNSIDEDEYPQTVEIERRCVNIIARLFHSPESGGGIGTATVGSSEAIHLGGLAMKWRWRARQQAAGKPTDHPNLVMGANVQVVWEKFARYFEVEPRYVPCAEGRWGLGVGEALQHVDENTIGVVGILGSTYTGEYEPIADLAAALDNLESHGGPHVPIHVDAASGGFVAPFTQPDLEWDFRVERVVSINTSGHKYGLVYPGIGWVVWRDKAELPDDLVFHVNYLGGDQPTFNLNFSRGAGQIIAQYYNFLRLGRTGYVDVMAALQETAHFLADCINALGHFDVLTRGDDLPVVSFRLRGDRNYDAFDVSDRLRARGWIVPAYTMPPDVENVTVLRVVVREGLSRDLVDDLVGDLDRIIKELDATPGAAGHRPGGTGVSSSSKAGRRGVC